MHRFAIVSLPPHPHAGQFGVVELSPSNWKEFADAKGRTYYHNQVTKATQWKRPKALQEQDWAEYKTPEGRAYYYNKFTKVTQWTKPEIPDDTEPSLGASTQSSLQSPLMSPVKEPLSPTSADSKGGAKAETEEPSMPDSNEYYTILELPSTATQQEIKTGYRQLARRFHPDRNGFDPVGIDRFQRAQQAYSVLIDPHKRRVYDAFVAYCRANDGEPSAFVPEFHAFLDLCDAMNVGVEPGTKDTPIVMCTTSNPNLSIREWRQFSTDDEQRYFVNVRTNVRQWQKPVDLLEFDVCSRLMGLRDSIAGPRPPQVPVPHTPAQPYFHTPQQQHQSPPSLHPTPHYGAASAATGFGASFSPFFPTSFRQDWSAYSGGL